jgi:hypothetical protein
MNRFKTLGIITGMATFLSIFGYWAKITHQPYADSVLKIGLWSLAVSAGLYVFVKVSRLNNKS